MGGRAGHARLGASSSGGAELVQHVLALAGNFRMDGLGPLLLAGPLCHTQLAFELAIKTSIDALGVRSHGSFLEAQIDAHRCLGRLSWLKLPARSS